MPATPNRVASLIVIALLLAIAVAAAGCGGTTNTNPPTTAQTQTHASARTVAQRSRRSPRPQPPKRSQTAPHRPSKPARRQNANAAAKAGGPETGTKHSPPKNQPHIRQGGVLARLLAVACAGRSNTAGGTPAQRRRLARLCNRSHATQPASPSPAGAPIAAPGR